MIMGMKNLFKLPVIGIFFFTILFLPACSRATGWIDPLPGAYQMNDYLNKLLNRKVGLVVNHSSTINSVTLYDTLRKSGVKIITLFTPEHGYFGNVEAGAKIKNGNFENDSVKVISLYSRKKKPGTDDMRDIDIMVFDLQDVGVRFFTFISTLHYVMEACAENNIPLLILDRPNPNGFYVDGPVLDTAYRSFIGLDPVPVVYGMTIGEYAEMINGEHWLPGSLRCDLDVVKCRNYTHESYYTLPLPPSPNLPDIHSIYLYPSTCFFEGTVISEGRGTDAPFCEIGHPDFSNHTFSFIPESKPGYSINPKFRGKICYGLDLRSISVDTLRNRRRIELGYLKLFFDDLRIGEAFFTDYFDQLAGNDGLRSQIVNGLSMDSIRQTWSADLEKFKQIRAKYLLYPDF
jgi:uncharacterized protein YbbC (DUF1343 family)